MPLIRFATLSDAERVAEIFRPYVLTTAVTFAIQDPAPHDFSARITGAFPFLVMEDEGTVVAYAYAGPHRALASYRWGVEVSLYVHSDQQRRGYATRLYRALFALLRQQGVLRAYAVITLPNPASVGLHEGLNFRPFAQFVKAGFKLGEWRDVGWWELSFRDPLPNPPPEILSIAAVREMHSTVVSRILSESLGGP